MRGEEKRNEREGKGIKKKGGEKKGGESILVREDW